MSLCRNLGRRHQKKGAGSNWGPGFLIYMVLLMDLIAFAPYSVTFLKGSMVL